MGLEYNCHSSVSLEVNKISGAPRMTQINNNCLSVRIGRPNMNTGKIVPCHKLPIAQPSIW